MQRAKDLLRHMYRVSGKNKEIPQTEEEYEQKKLNGFNYDIIHSFYKEVNSHPLVQGGHAVVELETLFANENSLTLGFTVKTANQNMSFSIGTELGDYRRYGEELHDKYLAPTQPNTDTPKQ